jgi:hypothetical protein
VDDPQLHHRQFVIGPEPLLVGEGWISEEIGPSLHLSRCPDLPAQSVTDGRGVRWHLLGIALQTAAGRRSPPEELASHESGSLLDLYGSWSGRWILLCESELHLDASGLLGCCYRSVPSGAITELWVSSSPAVLASLPGRPRPHGTAPRLHWAKGMEWYPPPRSRFAGVNRLLPTQILSLEPGERNHRVSPRPPLMAVAEPRDDEAVVDELQRVLVTSLSNLRERDDAVWLPLTGGLDSRLILATARHVGLRLTTFTHQWRLMPSGDRALPPRLAAELGYDHQFVPPGASSRRRRQLFDAHTAGHCVEFDRTLFSRGQWSAFAAPAVILRGGAFEVARCFYYRKFPEAATDDLAERIAHRFHFREFHPNSSAHFDGIAEWTEWVERTPYPGLDWRDRLYLEQRLGGWVSSIEQALDLTAYERFYLANSHLYISTALGLSEDARRVGRHHVELIRRMAPELLRFPFNPPDDALGKLSFKVLNEWRELSARRRKTGYAAYVLRRGIGRAKELVKGHR